MNILAKIQSVPVYVEKEPNELWEVYANHQDGTLLGCIQHITFCFPMNLFKPKGEYWFFPKFRQSLLDIGTGKSKEKAFEKFLDLYCEAKVKYDEFTSL